MVWINNNLLENSKFMNCEFHIDGDSAIEYMQQKSEPSVRFRFDANDDLVELWLVCKHLQANVSPVLWWKSKLLIDYMPYSRMDRQEGNSCFSLRYIATVINMLGFTNVYIAEPHSEVTTDMILGSVYLETSYGIFKAFMKENELAPGSAIVFPDKGAMQRYSHIDFSEGVYNILHGDKKRDFDTGKILSLDIIGDVPDAPFDAVIIDDLCSKGGTFMLTASKLKELGAERISLVVTHLEHTVYEGQLLEDPMVDCIYASDTSDILFLNPEFHHDKIHIIHMEDLYRNAGIM